MISVGIRKPKQFGTLGALLVACLLASGAGASVLAAQQAFKSPPDGLHGQMPPADTFASGAWLGVELKDVTAALAQSMKLPGEYGAIVAKVEPNSPASKAGIEVNDVILEFGSWKVWSAAQLAQLLRETPPGRTVELRVSRAGKMRNLQATLAARNPHAFMPQFNPPGAVIPPRRFNFHVPRNYNFHFDFTGPVLGIAGQTLTQQLATFFGVKQGSGVLVESVEKDSPAAKAGLEAGDCIVKVGSEVVASVSDLRRAIENTTDSELKLSVVRAKQERTLTAILEPGWRSKYGSRSPMWRGHEWPWPGWPGVRGELLSAKAQLAQIRALQRQIKQQLPRLEEQMRELNRQLPQLQKDAKDTKAQVDRQMPSLNNLALQIQKQARQLEQQAKPLEQMLQRMEAAGDTGAV